MLCFGVANSNNMDETLVFKTVMKTELYSLNLQIIRVDGKFDAAKNFTRFLDIQTISINQLKKSSLSNNNK